MFWSNDTPSQIFLLVKLLLALVALMPPRVLRFNMFLHTFDENILSAKLAVLSRILIVEHSEVAFQLCDRSSAKRTIDFQVNLTVLANASTRSSNKVTKLARETNKFEVIQNMIFHFASHHKLSRTMVAAHIIWLLVESLHVHQGAVTVRKNPAAQITLKIALKIACFWINHKLQRTVSTQVLWFPVANQSIFSCANFFAYLKINHQLIGIFKPRKQTLHINGSLLCEARCLWKQVTPVKSAPQWHS